MTSDKVLKPKAKPKTKAKAQLRLKDIARLAGVSKATASRAVSGTAFVAPETLRRIQEVVDEHGYVRNMLAGGLASNRSRLVAAILPTIGPSVFNEMIEAMIRALGRADYSVILGLASRQQEKVADAVTSMLSRRPEGIILTAFEGDAATRRRLAGSGVTIIQTWELPEDPIDVAVGFSHHEIGKKVAEYAISKGRRRPLFITRGYGRARERMQAGIETFDGFGCEIWADLSSTIEYVSGRRDLAKQLDSGARPDIVICSSDLVALGVLTEAAARGIRVPDDLAVIGFGNMELAADSAPSLTTVNIDGTRIGDEIAGVLLARAGNGEPALNRIDVGFSIIERDSA